MKIILIHRRKFQERPPVISVYSHLISLGHSVTLVTAGLNEYHRAVLDTNQTPVYIIPFEIEKSNRMKNIVGGFIWGRKARKLIRRLTSDEPAILWIEGNYTFDSLSARFINKYPHVLQHQELFNNPMTLKGRYTMKTLKRIMPTALVNIAPEYNRACIYKSIFQLNTLPTVLPNRPAFILDETKLKELAIKYENYGKIIGNRKVILYQGILSAERNLDNFIRATCELDPERYVTVLVGRKTKFVERYKAINPNLIHVDFIPAPDYLYFTSFAHIGIVTYKADSLNTMYCAPNKLFEYGAYGVPMLGNDIAGLKYTIEFCGCGLVCDENSVDSIKASIQRIEDNYQQFSKRAREYYNSVDNKMIIKKIVEMASSNLEAKI